MAADPVHEPDLDYIARHILPSKIDGVSYGVSLVHADTEAIRRELAGVRVTQQRHGELLEEILRRLPPAGS